MHGFKKCKEWLRVESRFVESRTKTETLLSTRSTFNAKPFFAFFEAMHVLYSKLANNDITAQILYNYLSLNIGGVRARACRCIKTVLIQRNDMSQYTI
jgi:hypothetical protein